MSFNTGCHVAHSAGTHDCAFEIREALAPLCFRLLSSRFGPVQSYQVFKYVLSATVIAAGWATLMLLIEIVQLIIGRKLRSTIWRAIVCVGDWVSSSLYGTILYTTALYGTTLHCTVQTQAPLHHLARHRLHGLDNKLLLLS